MKLLIPIVENEIAHMETPYGRSLYEIERKTILQHICEHFLQINEADFIFVLSKEDVGKYRLDSVIKLLVPEAKLVVTENKTAGAACSCLLAIDHLVPDEPLIVVGGDQIVEVNLQEVIDNFTANDYDGGIICFDNVHPRWSYIRLDENGLVAEAAEKTPISRNATTGFYYFKRSEDFTEAVFSMIRKKACVNGKYYVCPVYNELILKHKRIGAYFVEADKYFNFSHQNGVLMYETYLRQAAK